MIHTKEKPSSYTLNNVNPLRYLKGVGPRKEALLSTLGIKTLNDLLYYFPFRYEDRRFPIPISDLKVNEPALIKGTVLTVHLSHVPYFIRSRRVKNIFEAVITDQSGKIRCMWFNQGYLADILHRGDEIVVYGRLSYRKGKFQFIPQEHTVMKQEDNINWGRIVGIYSLRGNVSQKFMRKIIHGALEQAKAKATDALPFDVRQQQNLPNIAKSLEEVHFPTSWEEAQTARERFIFEELFYAQILVYLRKSKHRTQRGIPFKVNPETIKKIEEGFPFPLTHSQKEAVAKITGDLAKSYPMHRLLQGDVGSGKTIVASFGIGVCLDNGWQAALMVPTEVLAYQHKETLDTLFKGFPFKIEVLVSSLPNKKIKKIYTQLKEGVIQGIVGTHALIQEELIFKKLGLVIIDEQHKFGVAQRALLPKKGHRPPHCLVMSATPIPRSLALSLYGDLDLSVIKELPPGRILPQTLWVDEGKRQWVYQFLQEQLQRGRQGYIIYPLIEESQEQDLKSVEQMASEVQKMVSPFGAGIFHGRMKAGEKLDVIRKFREKKIDVLVSTTVVEVGVNIENATVMVVENPERFGLAQLHQLRGRVQRSSYQPYFILISGGALSPQARLRLEIISHEADGFIIAEEDLKLRGPGDFFGSSQHGFPELKIAHPLRDLDLLHQARLCAYKVIKNDPFLEKPAHRCIREHLDFWFRQ